MWIISCLVILGLIGYALFSKPKIKRKSISDIVKDDPYNRANDPTHRDPPPF